MQRVLGPMLANKVELIFYNERPFEETVGEVAKLPPQSAIFYQQLLVDSAGAVYGDKEPLKRIYEVANAPIFSFDESFFSGEVVGGPMFSPSEGCQTDSRCCRANIGRREGRWHQGSSNRILSTEIRLATTSTLEHQRKPPATGERNPVSGADRVGSVFLANCLCHSGNFSYRPALSQSCCVSIVGVNLPKCSRGNAWQSLPMSTASRLSAN